MGYGKKWSEEKVKESILKVINILGIDRMPSNSECVLALGSTALSNKISKNGGFYHWAEKMNLCVKSSETNDGYNFEVDISNKIEELTGFKTFITPVKFPYDILVNGVVKIDVKYSKGYDYKNGFYYSFNLEYDIPKSDLLVLVCGNEKILVIPSHEFLGIKQVSIGIKSKYDKYIEMWYFILVYNQILSNTVI